MYLSNMIKILQKILDKQGDCDILIDIPEREKFVTDFDIEGKWYSFNYYPSQHKPENHAFIIVYPE